MRKTGTLFDVVVYFLWCVYTFGLNSSFMEPSIRVVHENGRRCSEWVFSFSRGWTDEASEFYDFVMGLGSVRMNLVATTAQSKTKKKGKSDVRTYVASGCYSIQTHLQIKQK
ncbi:hypothetical protein BDN70DRAFT_876654 [Pholiota conissans]|uniref:Uncharacterized protein n=1 Tax=Pholiota conissans TaxID=109636 RepID=A0A9P5Z6N8_9AGAR|nr:hypothetical protein BDN70DRAFT_876654 [Pholiota conissans]